MRTLLYVLIGCFGIASYLVGIYQIIKNRYKPSVFSRFIWVLLAINSFAGVALSRSSTGSILLAVILLAGNIAVCLASFWKGSREFGKLEFACLGILALSVIIWIVFSAPLINLGLSLFAHFVAAAPTYKRVWRNPANESTAFWSLFFVASILSVLVSFPSSPRLVILPIYFALFDGSMFALSMRRRAQ